MLDDELGAPLPAEKRIHLVVAYDPDALELDDQWTHLLAGSLARDGLDQMRSHLIELEERIPWNAVDNTRWEGVRARWIVTVRQPGSARTLGDALAQLEAAMLPHAFTLAWPELRAEWRAETLAAASGWRLRELLLLFEANLRWLCFIMHDAAYTPALQAILASAHLKSAGKPRSKKPGGKSATAILIAYQRALHGVLQRVETYSYDTAAEFVAATLAALAGHNAFAALRAQLRAILTASGAFALDGCCSADAAARLPTHLLPRHLLHVAWLQGGRAARHCTPGIGDPLCLCPALSEASAAMAAAAASRHAAARRASSRWAIQLEQPVAGGGVLAAAHHSPPPPLPPHPAPADEPSAPTRVLLIFKDDANDASLAGAIVLRPYHTLADVRARIEAELRLPAPHSLFRARRLAPAPSSAAPAAAPVERAHDAHPMLLRLHPLQDHKLAYQFFTHARDVLVARRRPRSDLADSENARVVLRSRPSERLLCVDVADGLERSPIPVYNGVDAEPPPLDFSYVPQCVAVESVRLLALYDAAWPLPAGCGCTCSCSLDGGVCMCVHRDGVSESYARKQPAYAASRVLKRAYESIYECHLLCACALSCANRVVQRGMAARVEVFRTPKAGWAVRTVDAVRAGAFVCEYAGEHLPDDEAEERGIRYDQHGMSRLMDVQGDGPDALRMCVDATNFSSVARFVNHSCAPNCHKQRVFADHHTRLPRIALFALCDIAPLEELSYDYGYLDVPGKTLPCYCGAKNCKAKLY